jgi:hypothetical protein
MASMQRFFRYRGCISEELKKQNHTAKADISTLPGSGHLNFALTDGMCTASKIRAGFRKNMLASFCSFGVLYQFLNTVHSDICHCLVKMGMVFHFVSSAQGRSCQK